MRASVDLSVLSLWLRFCDKLMGSSEFSFGNIYFSYSEGLVLRATDGCLHGWTKIGECEPFNGEIAIPLRLLKGFLVGESGEFLNLALMEDEIVLSSGNETLRMKLTGKREKQVPVEHEPVAKSDLLDFNRALDFATSPLEEGDFALFGSFQGELLMFASTRSMICLTRLVGEAMKPFVFSFPYMSARHIVKALEVYAKNVQLNIGLGEALLIRSGDFTLQLCGEHASFDPRIGDFLQKREAYVVPRNFQRFVSKAAWLMPRESTVRIECAKNTMRFFGAYGTVLYKAMLPFDCPLRFEFEFSPHKLRSALARMSNKLSIDVGDDFVKIQDSAGRAVVVKKL
jgi:hypothetical protein